jgi:hypothetical protein
MEGRHLSPATVHRWRGGALSCHYTKEGGSHQIRDPSNPWQRVGGGVMPACTGGGRRPALPLRARGGAAPSRAVARRRRGLPGSSGVGFDGEESFWERPL